MNWATDISAVQWVFLVSLSLVAGLDRTALAQTFLCRPVVCGALCGFIMGEYSAGLVIGSVMELLWLMRLPVGATVAPDDTQATIAAVFLYSGLSTRLPLVLPEEILMVVVVFFAALFSHLGRLVDIGARHMNGRVQHQAQIKLERTSGEHAARVLCWSNLTGLMNFSLAGLFSQIIILCATLASIVLAVPMLERFTWQEPGVALYAALLAGVGAVYAFITVRYGVILFGIGFGVTLLFTLV
jgi:PTS system mannose-specific IIC component